MLFDRIITAHYLKTKRFFSLVRFTKELYARKLASISISF